MTLLNLVSMKMAQLLLFSRKRSSMFTYADRAILYGSMMMSKISSEIKEYNHERTRKSRSAKVASVGCGSVSAATW